MTATTPERAEAILAAHLLSLRDVWPNSQVDLMDLYAAGKVPPGNPCWQYVIDQVAARLDKREYTDVGMRRVVSRLIQEWADERARVTPWPPQPSSLLPR